LVEYLHSKGVIALVHYPKPIHMHEAYQYLGYRAGAFPVAERLCNEVISLPLFPEITDEQIAFVADNVRTFFGARA